MSTRDTILNGVISVLRVILDSDIETKDILIIRRYEDAPRPSNSIQGSDNNYASSVFGEISLDDMTPFNICKSQSVDECDGKLKEYSYKESRVVVTLDFVGCGAWDVASLIVCNLGLSEVRDGILPECLSYIEHGRLVDVTALEEARHTERVTFEMEFIYSCVAEADVFCVMIDDVMRENECGTIEFQIESNIN